MRALIILWFLGSMAHAQERSMILASTTSTQNSGLLDVILPEFEAASGIHVYVVAVGTGQALRIARTGDADAILVHHRASEDAFLADGYGVGRVDVMYNDFVIIGPKDDPANIAGVTTAAQAFANIRLLQTQFVSRGDLSGTHLKELELWEDAAVQPDGPWYLEVGSGMGAALNLASGLNAYILSDRGTWVSFQNRADLELLFEGGPEMHNPYGYIRVNPQRFSHIKATESAELAAWLVSDEAQGLIAGYQLNGMHLFCPNVSPLWDQQNDQQGTCATDALQR